MTNTEKYKKNLEDLLQQITNDLKELGIQNPQVPSDWIATPADKIESESDENIAADRSEQWQERRATVAVLETRYNNIARALKKLKMAIMGYVRFVVQQ